MFKPGKFHHRRHEICQQIQNLRPKTGDIFCRLSNQVVWGIIPFSVLTAYFTQSPYSHCSIVLVEKNGDIYLVEQTDRGCEKLRLIDWISTCQGSQIEILRYNQLYPIDRYLLTQSIKKFLCQDPDFDFTFDQPDKFYCVESVIQIYKNAHIIIGKKQLLKSVMKKHWYCVALVINYLIRNIAQKGFDPNEPLYWVGNKDQGLLADPSLQSIKIISVSETQPKSKIT